MKEIQKLPTRKDLVNRLIRDSFGRKFFGDCRLRHDSEGDLPSRIDNLNEIGTYSFNLLTGVKQKIVGRFLSTSGNSLEISPRYADKARKYAELFEKEIGEEVTIVYSNN